MKSIKFKVIDLLLCQYKIQNEKEKWLKTNIDICMVINLSQRTKLVTVFKMNLSKIKNKRKDLGKLSDFSKNYFVFND